MLRDLLTRRLSLIICGTAAGQAGSDGAIRFGRAAAFDLRAKIVLYQPRYLCFNGKRAAQEFFGRKNVEYGVQEERIGRTVMFVAPSTSGAANGTWDVSIWQDLAKRVLRASPSNQRLQPTARALRSVTHRG